MVVRPGKLCWTDPTLSILGGTKLTNNVGELQAMCCAVLWLIEQNRIDDSMRLEIRFDSKHASAAAVGTQRCSSNTELVHKSDITGNVVSGVT